MGERTLYTTRFALMGGAAVVRFVDERGRRSARSSGNALAITKIRKTLSSSRRRRRSTLRTRSRPPLLIAQGANDVRVVPAESEQILSAIEKNKGRATYVVYSDEGHGFLRPENNLDFTARAESFLAGCLSGRAEPMQQAVYPGSTAAVKEVGGKSQ